MHQHRDVLLQELFSQADAGRLFVLLDGARDEAIRPEIEAASNESVCLFKGAPPILEAAAPWLVELGADADSFSEWLVGRGFGRAWGVFVVTHATLEELRKHFRQFLRVKRSDGRAMLLRYYDPRVWRSLLPSCEPSELELFFGPVDAFLLEDLDANVLLRFTLGAAGELTRAEIRLEELEPPLEALVAHLREGEGAAGLLRARLTLARAPGEARLLAYVAELGASLCPAHLGAGVALKRSLEDLRPAGFPAAALRAAFAAFPAAESWREPFAILAPMLQAWLTQADRQRLRESSLELILLGEAIAEVRALRSHLRGLEEDAASEDEQASAVVVAVGDLSALEARLARLSPSPVSPGVVAFHKGLVRFNKRLALRGTPKPSRVVAGISSLLVTVKASKSLGQNHHVASVASGLVHALEATSPGEGGG